MQSWRRDFPDITPLEDKMKTGFYTVAEQRWLEQLPEQVFSQ